jgi:predicted lysophospholipase L1 biosynthesis ABC-type transport system permease subunit
MFTPPSTLSLGLRQGSKAKKRAAEGAAARAAGGGGDEVSSLRVVGATRGTIVRQFLVESLLFSTVAGVLGALLAMWTLSAIQASVAALLPPNR